MVYRKILRSSLSVMRSRSLVLRVVGAIFFVIALWQGAEWMHQTSLLDTSWIGASVSSRPITTSLSFIGVYAAATMCGLPASPLNFAAGAIWGILWGTVLTVAGATIGAAGAFLLGRMLVGPKLLKKYDHRLLTWVREEANRRGWMFIAYIRLNPAFPTGPVNYLLGLTEVKFVTYVLSTAVFLTPPSAAIAYAGIEMGGPFVSGHAFNLWHVIQAGGILAVTTFGYRQLAKVIGTRERL